MRPVLVLGGRDNALSIARSLGRKRVPVFLSVEGGSSLYHSRYCAHRYSFETQASASDYWTQLLLEKPTGELDDAILLGCSDDAVEFLAQHRSKLKKRYTLDLFDPDVQLAMLDKTETLELAQAAGCAVPKSYDLTKNSADRRLPEGMQYPLLIKPKLSHLFQRAFDGKKFLTVADDQELKEGIARVLKHGLDAMLCELIPGPDSLLCSYYTYIDEHGDPLFHYTKRIIRRFPTGQGGGAYHEAVWLPEVAEEGLKFFRGVNFRGFGNIEFKRDLRDQRLKVIECNPRFTAAQELLARSGYDTADFIYSRLTDAVPPKLDAYEQNLKLWYPIPDLKAFLELRSRRQIGTLQWMKSISRGRKVFPMFSFDDPVPSIVWNARLVGRIVKHRLLRR